MSNSPRETMFFDSISKTTRSDKAKAENERSWDDDENYYRYYSCPSGHNFTDNYIKSNSLVNNYLTSNFTPELKNEVEYYTKNKNSLLRLCTILYINRKKLIFIFVFSLSLIFLSFALRNLFTQEQSEEKPLLQFVGTLQLQSYQNEFIEWNSLHNSLSSKSQDFTEKISMLLKVAMETEGIKVDKISVFKLAQARPLSFTRTEEVFRKPHNVSKKKQAVFTEISYENVSYINMSFNTFSNPLSNAAVFDSIAVNQVWDLVAKQIELRLASAGLQTKYLHLKPDKSFKKVVKNLVKVNPYIVTTPKVQPKKVDLCDCEKTGLELSVVNPNIICDCINECDFSAKYLIRGGVNGVFTLRTPICPAAFFMNLISKSKRYVEVVYSGFKEVKSITNMTNNSLLLASKKIFTNSYTIKSIGYAVAYTQPPTTGNPAVGGFFHVSQSTKSPFAEHDPVRNATVSRGFPIMHLSVFVKEKKLRILRNYKNQKLQFQDNLIAIENQIKFALKRWIPAKAFTWQLVSVDLHRQNRAKIVASIDFFGHVADAVREVKRVDKTGDTFFNVALKNISIKLISLRFGTELLNALMKSDGVL